MKKIKLSSTVFLASLALSVMTGVVATADATTPGIGSFIKDNTPVKPTEPGEEGPKVVTEPDEEIPGVTKGDLAFVVKPKEFNFGIHKVSAADKAKSVVSYTQKNYLSQENSDVLANNYEADVPTNGNIYPKETQAISVWDGRIQHDDWSVGVSATPFKNTAGNELTGAVIKIKTDRTYNQVAKGSGDLTALSNFEIKTDGSVSNDILKTTTGLSAKDQSDLLWKVKDVTLEFPGSVLEYGDYSSMITWTLTGTPDA